LTPRLMAGSSNRLLPDQATAHRMSLIHWFVRRLPQTFQEAHNFLEGACGLTNHDERKGAKRGGRCGGGKITNRSESRGRRRGMPGLKGITSQSRLSNTAIVNAESVP